MIQGIRQRRKACAAALMWRTIPFARSPKNQFHKFLDLSLQLFPMAWSNVRSDLKSASPAAGAYLDYCRKLQAFVERNNVSKQRQIERDKAPTAKITLPTAVSEFT